MLPAAMKLLGDWNWYLPSWLEWLPRIGDEGDFPAPPTDPPASGPAEEPRAAPAQV
jgi:hypothetical protein